ncbi:trichohyalin-like [Littorina saxatilis]|uniref:trichohyalin-like n=1 Tax=Littorina saxatilis TaxID=31220 RepID=UPI0038B45854
MVRGGWVAITVFWIGRVAEHSFQGPKIDQSAFSALVHNQHRHRDHIVSDGQLRKESSNSWESGSNCHPGAYGANERASLRENSSAGPRHVRDGSYDSYSSYGKGSEDSLEEAAFEVDENGMPIPRYNSSSALNRSRDRPGRHLLGDGDSAMYSSDRNSSLYRSSPDLSRSTLSNRRSSSTDSADGSFSGGGHSRQSSDSVDYPTRRYSTQLNPGRKTSVSADPLQFVKMKGATDLASTAEEQIKLAAETKKLKISGSISEDDSTDWQNNLSSWKNRRKSQSEKSYQMKEELEQMEKEKEEPPAQSSFATKTFTQMKQERERRKSAGNKFCYPIDDEGEDDIFSASKPEEKRSSPATRRSSRNQPSAREEVQESKPGNATRGTGRRQEQQTNNNNEEEEEEEEEEEAEEAEEEIKQSKPTPVPETRASRFSRDADSNASRQRRSGVPEYTATSRDSLPRSGLDRESASKENNRNSANNNTAAPKSSSKISNILKSFEQKEEETAKPKSSGVDSSIDFTARKKSFEKFGAQPATEDSFYSRSWNTEEARPSKVISKTSSSAVYASTKTAVKDYVEKNIKISQKANNTKGFGFTLSGGADKQQPVVVEKISLGSAADVCELQGKDEVISINGKTVMGMTSAELSNTVKDAVRVGLIELRVKRFLGSGGDFDEDEDFLSTDEEIETPDRSVSKSSSVRAENSFDSLDSREDHLKTELEKERQWIEEQIPVTAVTPQSTRRGEPASISSDSGYDAQTFSPYHRGDNSSNEEEINHLNNKSEPPKRPSLASRTRHLYPCDDEEDEVDYVNVPNNNSAYSSDIYADQRGQREVIPSQQVEVESRPSITVRREVINVSQQEEDDSKPLATFESHYEVASVRRGEDKQKDRKSGQASDGGPPAALRKWQRHQPREEYTFESDEPPKFYDQMKMTSSLARQSESPADDTHPEDTTLHKVTKDYDDTVHSQPPLVSTRRSFKVGDDRRRIQDWNQQQEDERQQSDQPLSSSGQNPIEVTLPFDQRRYATDREQLEQQYQTDLQHAAESERQNQEQERQMLEPEMEKTRRLEERRAQRQARLQQYAQDSSIDTAPPPTSTRRQQRAQNASDDSSPSFSRRGGRNVSDDSPPAVSRAEMPYGAEEVHGGRETQAPMPQHTSMYTAQIQGGRTAGVRPGEMLVIDPRNRAGENGPSMEVGPPGQPINFQLQINSRETAEGIMIQPQMVQPTRSAPPPQIDHAAFLEAEREKIRQEELARIESERRQREEEEMRQIRQKEEQLRQQEEKLRRQEEEIRRSKEQLERERQQMHQQQYASPPQQAQYSHQQQYASPPQQAQYSHQPDHSRPSNTPDESIKFETVTSKVRGGSPAYTSTIVAGPRRSDSRPQVAASHAGRSHDPGAHSDRGQDGYGVRRSEPSWNSSRPQQNTSWRAGASQQVSASQTSLPKWPPQGQEQGRGGGGSSGQTVPNQYSREDMLAMNRKATPMQAKPPSLSSRPDHQEAVSSSPVRREAPSKGQLHSLNSVPKAKFRDPEQWISDEAPPPHHQQPYDARPQKTAAPSRRSEPPRNPFSGPRDHWLVEEAERRRVNQSTGPSRAQVSGPIKAATDDHGNRWRGGPGQPQRSPNMPDQLRQTLLQKTAGARGSNGSSYSQDLNPPSSHSPAYSSSGSPNLSQNQPADYFYEGGYQPGSRSQTLPPQHRAPSPEDHRENGVGVSGKQRCSHCANELGFGAAMVIESLGLYYHTQCFKCCVCRTPLGNGVEGADVRVRVNKLHCPNCYSNDEAGLKFSKV